MSTALKTALTNLAALNVAGITQHYGIDTVPDALSRAQLPALLMLLIDNEDRLFQERSDGFTTVAFSQGARTVTYSVLHLLLLAPLESGAGLRSHLPNLVDAMDAYFAALATDVRLGGALLEPAHVAVEPGRFVYGKGDYIGCAFRHTWLVEV